jgi:hypothetical protein
LHHTGAVNYGTEAQIKNYERLNKLLEGTEEIVWAIAPPRSMIPLITRLRETGEMDADLAQLLEEADKHGRSTVDDWTNFGAM